MLSSKRVQAERGSSATLRAQGHLERNTQGHLKIQLSTCCIESGVVQEGMETEVGGRLGGGDGRWQTEPLKQIIRYIEKVKVIIVGI